MSDAPHHTFVVGATPEIYECIGRVAAAWAHLEHMADQEIWQLAGVRMEAGACITSHLQSLNRRLQALIALVRLRNGGDALVGKLNKFVALTDRLSNRAVHDPWLIIGDGPGRFEVTANRKLVFQFQPETADRLKEVESEIDRAIKEFAQLSHELVRLAQVERE